MSGKKLRLMGGVLIGVITMSGAAYAATNTEFTQVINNGVLTADIKDASRASVANPSVNMSAISTSSSCQTPGTTGTFGTNTQRVYVDNPGGANNGWTLAIAPTSGPTATWTTSGSNTLDFNDSAAAGCTNGQMTINPAASTITTDCDNCSATGVTKGSSASFSQGTTDSITLINAATASDNIWRGYLTGATVSQVIPAETPADSYKLNLTVTATAQ